MSDGKNRPEQAQDQNVGTVATENPGGDRPGERQEVGDAASSQRHPPHVTKNDKGAPAQSGQGGPEAPVLPANAAGHDRVSSTDQDFEVDEGSAYDRRPSQDKNRPPSKE